MKPNSIRFGIISLAEIKERSMPISSTRARALYLYPFHCDFEFWGHGPEFQRIQVMPKNS